jgi:hypothetical protein
MVVLSAFLFKLEAHMSMARSYVYRGAAKCVAIVATLNLSGAKAFACDLSPLTHSVHAVPVTCEGVPGICIGFYQIHNFQFTPGPPGYVKVVRSTETIIAGLSEAIEARLNAIDAELPKNECNEAASLTSRFARVTPPTFTISATVEGNLWGCTPVVKIPCPPPHPRLELETPSRKLAGSDYQIAPMDKTILQVNFLDDFFDWVPKPKLPEKPEDLLPTPDKPAPGVDIKMCDSPRVKTTTGISGRVTVTYILSGQVRDNAPQIDVSKPNVQSNVTDQTRFLLNILGGPVLGGFVTGQLEKELASIAADKTGGLIPDKIQLPKQEEEIRWSTKDAVFGQVQELDARQHNNRILPAFVVTQEWNTREILACIFHEKMLERQ